MHKRVGVDGPVFESALKKEDFPTLGTPCTISMDFAAYMEG